MSDRIHHVIDNVFHVAGTCSSYVIVDGDAALVIDPGDGEWFDELGGLGIAAVDWVLLTHTHRDQCSGLYRCLLYTSPSPRDGLLSRMPSSA